MNEPWTTPEPAVLADGHVHLHPSFRAPRFLAAARTNLAAAARREGLDPDLPACLLLAEAAGCDRFGELEALAAAAPAPGAELGEGWSVLKCDEDGSLLARGPAGEELFLLAGRQVRARGGLEVLSLLSPSPVPDGLPFPQALEAVWAAGGTAVVPWGFGKWTGRRGRVVREALREALPGRLLLGDNGGRLEWGWEPSLFRRAAERGIPVLPGTDPLPFPWEEGRAGSYGFCIPGWLDIRRPATWMRERLLSLRASPRPVGRRAELGWFLLHQTLMQVVPRPRRSA